MDSTLRDGEQAAGVALTADEKAEYVRLAESAGIRYLEIGFPQNPQDFEACKAAAAAATCSRLVALALPTKESVEKVAEVGAHEVLIVVPCSYGHIQHLYQERYLENLRLGLQVAVARARELGLAVNIGLEDASQRDISLLAAVVEASTSLRDGISCLTVADTRGQLLPDEAVALVSLIRDRLGQLDCPLAFHAHNDLGLATANSLAVLRMERGVHCVHVTTCGFGERAGNASLEQLVALLELKLRRSTGIDLTKLTSLTDYVQDIFMTPLHPHAPIVGTKVFLHESGIHQKAMMRDQTSYQFLEASRFGRRSELVLGKHSGKGLRAVLAAEAGVSDNAVLSLQMATTSRDKSKARAAVALAAKEIREAGFVGLSQHDAVDALRRAHAGTEARPEPTTEHGRRPRQ